MRNRAQQQAVWWRRFAAIGLAACVFATALPGRAASQHYGQVTFGAVPVPGATITASQGDKQVVTSTDQDGVYRFADLADGAWKIRVEMIGFTTITTDVTVAPDSPPSTWNLVLRPFDEIAREIPKTESIQSPAATNGNANTVRLKPETTGDRSRPGTAGSPAPPKADAPRAAGNQADAQRGFQRASTTAAAAAPAETGPATSDAAPPPSPFGTADGLLVNGSVNNGAASPFAQLAAFGNNRRGLRSLYTGGVATILGNSAWDAAPFSFVGQPTPKPSYTDVQIAGNVGGPLRIPGLLKNGPNMFVGFQRTSDHSANTLPTLVPTALERIGDFSQSVDAFGRPVQIVDKAGVPFAGNRIPRNLITPQAAALLDYYPLPNINTPGRNFQAPLVTITRQDSVQTRITQSPFGRNQLNGTFAFQRTETTSTNVFGFTDTTESSGIDSTINWSRRFSPFLSVRARYQVTRLHTQADPFFANRFNVSGDAGIAGNNQEPANWGPPTLTFSSGFESLGTAQANDNVNLTHWWSGEAIVSRGRHLFTTGGGVHRQQVDVVAQQNARGAFTFNGGLTGSDFADFLLGIPTTASLATGNADKQLRGFAYEAYVDDDWRISPGLSVKLGVRWEYESPLTERLGRLVNLDVAPGFAAVDPVLGTNPVGRRTGITYPTSLLRPDWRGVQPRLGTAWRPVAGSSLVIRAGYGIYRNTNVYQPVALLLAQQPPISTTFTIQNTAQKTMADIFVAPGVGLSNTFAVDPDFRVGYAENWQASLQRDLPASLTVLATYLGTRGSHLMQEFLPNTYPSGALNPCPSCPSGFVYLTSNGHSSRHAAQLEVRRRLRNGVTATGRYTLAKANDDAGAFTGVSLNGSAIAQDWLNLDAEWAPSNFDQRHLFTLQVQYSSGVGVSGGTLVDGLKGTLLKGWTLTSQLNAGSGLPFTPIYLSPVPGTGVTGTLRPDVVGATAPVDEGSYGDPSAFAAPAPGRWGTAGRNSLTGPAQFGLNAGITRTFTLGARLNLDWRVDASNVLNRVTYTGVNALFGSPQFGLPNRVNTMRKVQTTFRLRF